MYHRHIPILPSPAHPRQNANCHETSQMNRYQHSSSSVPIDSYYHNRRKINKKVTYRFKNEKFKIWDYFVPIKLLSASSCSVVIEAKDTRFNGHPVVIKKNKYVFTELNNAKQALREIKLLSTFKHDDIMRLLDVIPPDEHNKDTFNDVYLVMRKMETTLKRIIQSDQRLENRHYLFFIYQILRGLKYIHSAGVIHGDLTPEHILVNGKNCNVKISGLGSELPAIHHSNTGNSWYCAPERMLCGPNCDKKQVDIWSVGCIFAELMIRRELFPGTNIFEQLSLIFSIVGVPYCYQYIYDCGYNEYIVCGFIRSCWKTKPFNDLRKPSLDVIGMIQSFYLHEMTHSNCDWITSLDAKQWVQQKKAEVGHDFRKIFKNGKPEAIGLMKQMLQINPSKRITVIEALSHPYLSKLHHPKSEKIIHDKNVNKNVSSVEQEYNTINGIRHLLYQTLIDFDPGNPRRYPRPPAAPRASRF